ncbi:MAG: hypothetical protein N2110_00075 [Flavobacteriales bacterium]|nr:hypothetical protein [Flavobacteriales bacterium]MCX7767405.1 hypothetical protein [Flavobacteriales bacterium]MDW8410179.1 hypothetical protein [Flavobacteriales bacterium]
MTRKLILLSALFFLALQGCKKEVCIRCTPIVEGSAPEARLCSSDRYERADFMYKKIKEGFNCAEE